MALYKCFYLLPYIQHNSCKLRRSVVEIDI